MTSPRRWLLAAMAAACSVTTLFAQSARPERVYLTFQPGAKAAAQAAVRSAGGQVHHEFDDLAALAISVPAPALNGLSRNPNVRSIESDPSRQLIAASLQATTGDTSEVPYGVALVQADTLHQQNVRGAGVKVGVIDSGVYQAHTDLPAAQLTGEPDAGATNERTWYRDYDSHGTHVTGTILAVPNDTGVVGVAPAASVHMVKVFGDVGQWIYSSDLLAAARAAASSGARIISMSLGGERASVTERRGLESLYQNGLLLIAAAGNDGNTAYSYPASYDCVISVGALDANRAAADFSQANDQVELSAPGVAVVSTTSYVEEVTVTAGTSDVAAVHVEFAARGTASGTLVDGGLGTTTSANWAGQVVLVQRGENTFFEKVRNVQLSGGLACILYNNLEEPLHATLGEGNTSSIPAVGLSQSEGLALREALGQGVTVTDLLTQPTSGFAPFNGTSMATPHVSGVAALLWSKYPAATAVQIREAMNTSAVDLGTAGRDASYGYGLVQASAALEKLGTIIGTPPPNSGDTTAPQILNLQSASTNLKSGGFEITWQTDEPARSSVTLAGKTTTSRKYSTSHRFTFKGTPGAVYPFSVSSTDRAGNTATASGTHQN